MKKTTGIIAVLISLALIVGALVGGLTAVVLAGVREGEIGLSGLDGIDGIAGLAGLNGNDGTDGEQGTRGPKGATGSTGATGSRGPAGEDCECKDNQAPVITIDTSDSAYDGLFYFRITIEVDDAENDDRVIDLYHKHHEDDNWLRSEGHGWIQHWYSNNNSDIFTAEHIVDYATENCEDIWWLVEVNEGKNLVITEEHTELCGPE